MKKAYEQVAEIYSDVLNRSPEEFKIAFQEWCATVGYTEEKGNEELFSYGSTIGMSILNLYFVKELEDQNEWGES
jgi:hypothetical protein